MTAVENQLFYVQRIDHETGKLIPAFAIGRRSLKEICAKHGAPSSIRDEKQWTLVFFANDTLVVFVPAKDRECVHYAWGLMCEGQADA